jgi:hypothetical protein
MRVPATNHHIGARLMDIRTHTILLLLCNDRVKTSLLTITITDSYTNPTVRSARIPHTALPFLFLLSATFAGFLLLFLTHKALFDLALLMCRIDLFAFGGGFASV